MASANSGSEAGRRNFPEPEVILPTGDGTIPGLGDGDTLHGACGRVNSGEEWEEDRLKCGCSWYGMFIAMAAEMSQAAVIDVYTLRYENTLKLPL